MDDLIALEALTYTLNHRIALLEKITTIAACTGLKSPGPPGKNLKIPEKLIKDTFYTSFFQTVLGAPDDAVD